MTPLHLVFELVRGELKAAPRVRWLNLLPFAPLLLGLPAALLALGLFQRSRRALWFSLGALVLLRFPFGEDLG